MKKVLRLLNFLYVIPFGIAAIMALIYMLGGWENVFENHGPEFYFLPELKNLFFGLGINIVVGVFLFVFIRFSTCLLKKITKIYIKEIIISSVIFVVSVGMRLFLVYLFQEDLMPFSDFANAWDWAHGLRTQEEVYVYSPAYLNYAYYLEYIVGIFGDNYVNVLVLNSVWSGITAVLLYYLTKQIVGGTKLGMLAAFLYAFMPSDIFYNTIGNPEFLTISFNTLSILLLVKSLECANRKAIFLLVLSGVFLGIGNSFKSFGGVIIIAYSVIVICKILLDIKGQEKNKRIVACIIGICCLCCLCKIVGNSIEKHTEKNFEISFDNGAMSHFLTVGLNRQGEGQIHVGELSRTYRKRYTENGRDAKEATEYAYNVLVSDWKGNLDEIPEFLIKKMIWTWQDNMMPIHYFNNSVGLKPNTLLEENVYRISNEYVPAVAQVYYFLLMLLSVLGAYFVLQKKLINHKLNLCYLIVFGYFCMMLLSEAQSRYKSLIMPFVCVAAVEGICWLCSMPFIVSNKEI